MYNLIVFSSINLANRVKKSGEKNGIFIGLQRTPKNLSQRSCSYSLRVKEIFTREILKYSNEANIKTLGIYKEIKDDDNIKYKKIE